MKTILALSLCLFACCLSADDKLASANTTSANASCIWTVDPTVCTLTSVECIDLGGVHISCATGKVAFSQDAKPDAAALEFWRQIALQYPEVQREMIADALKGKDEIIERQLAIIERQQRLIEEFKDVCSDAMAREIVMYKIINKAK
jgi:hypothetical protein